MGNGTTQLSRPVTTRTITGSQKRGCEFCSAQAVQEAVCHLATVRFCRGRECRDKAVDLAKRQGNPRNR
ncbi:MAG: hypothetical protein PHI63_03715 [Patescibacteria group bacterium]|nr:hypothetical protein [Patescibacteria group bacterium]